MERERWDLRLERRSIQTGMVLRTLGGTRLGRVMLIGSEVMYVRPWGFSRRKREFTVPLSRVRRVTGGTVYLEGSPSKLREPVGNRPLHDIPTHVYPLAESASTGNATH